MSDQYIDIVFDGAPGPHSGRFVEVENEDGMSIKTGEWVGPEEEGGLWRLRIHTDRGVNSLAELIHDISTEHGFEPPSRANLPEKLMLMVSELSEALESLRNDDPLVWYKHEDHCPGMPRDRHDDQCNVGQCNPKPEGVATEVGDAVIRGLHIMHSLLQLHSMSVHDVLWKKMQYNAKRSHKHGKAF